MKGKARPRRREVPKREILPDPKFGNVDVAKFVNVLMLSGKKSVAENIIYGAFEHIQTKSGKDPLEVFATAVGNCKPLVEVKSRRVGGATYQVPIEVRPERAQALAFRWLISAARGRSGQTMIDKLSAELRDAADNKGSSVKKKDDTHKMAEANRAFAHYRY